MALFTIDFQNAVTPGEKLEYLVELRQLLHEEHVAEGAKVVDAATQSTFRTYQLEARNPKRFALEEAKNAVEEEMRVNMKSSPVWPSASVKDSFKES